MVTLLGKVLRDVLTVGDWDTVQGSLQSQRQLLVPGKLLSIQEGCGVGAYIRHEEMPWPRRR